MTGSAQMEGQTGNPSLGQQAELLAKKMQEVRSEISKAIVGQTEVVDGVLNALLAGGHVLLEGAPGLGKTMLVRTLAQAVALKYSRIQFTPDLMPADVIGTSMVQEGGEGKHLLGFQPGPIFTNLLLADEINRATPKTQSALLEAMQEKQVTVGHTSHHFAPTGRALFRDGHAKPIGNGRHVPAAGSAARPFSIQVARAVSRTRGTPRNSGPHHGGRWAAGGLSDPRAGDSGDAAGGADCADSAARSGVRREACARDASGGTRKSACE
jgi:hypothetical protein